ncbi:MAG: outer membrane lipoprotein-sorting protein [Phenylobacterium sp.]
MSKPQRGYPTRRLTLTLIGLTLIGLALVSPVVPAAAWATESAQEIVAKADAVRNPDHPFRGVTTLTEYRGGKPAERNVLAIWSKIDPASHQFHNLVRYVDPPRDAGKMVLLGHELWFYDPASKTSVRISPQQRLTGQASIGDVLTVNLAIDYTATLTGSEAIADAGKAQRQCWRLDMKAATPNATYNHVEYWIEQGSYRPIKGKFYSDSGRLLKILYYRDFKPTLGGERPGQAVILDAVDPSLVTTVDFSEQRFQDIPDAWFQRDYLPHFTGK